MTFRSLCLVALPSPWLDEPAMDVPLGLAYISAYLKKHGFMDIRLVDYNAYDKYNYYDEEKYLSELPRDADVYGIQCMTPQFWWLVKVAEHIRKVNPEALIVAGGPHPSSRPEECLTTADVDVVVVGDGEKTMLDIMKIGKSFFKVLCYDPVTELDSLPFPDRDLFPCDKYKRTILGERAFHIITLRGCPYHCAFCSKPSVGDRVRWRSVENVLSEIDFLIKKYGVTSFVIYDDIFTLRLYRVLEFCSAFKERGIHWRCWSRVDTLDKLLLATMKDSGLTSITLGIESGDDHILEVLNKGVTAEDNKRALNLCRELNVPVRASIIYGSPYETKESVENTISLIEETQPDEWNISSLIPIPGSLIGDNPEKYGVTMKPDPYYRNYFYVGGKKGLVDEVPVRISTLSDEEYLSLRSYMVRRLEEVCPRRKIQDTIQHLKL